MDILEKIVSKKRQEIETAKSVHTIQKLEKSSNFSRPILSLSHALTSTNSVGIIAEFKRKSPSLGWININASVEKITAGYVNAGASALSILTDNQFFGGSNEDLIRAKESNPCPILRKEFIIDEYQVIETKSIGADAMLLIAATLKPDKLKTLCNFAKSLGLEVLVEVHNLKELESNLDCNADIIGVNNRNLKTFEQSISVSKQLASHIPNKFVKISESGIESPENVIELKEYGYNGFLIGQTFMKNENPENAAMNFIIQLSTLQNSNKV